MFDMCNPLAIRIPPFYVVRHHAKDPDLYGLNKWKRMAMTREKEYFGCKPIQPKSWPSKSRVLQEILDLIYRSAKDWSGNRL